MRALAALLPLLLAPAAALAIDPPAELVVEDLVVGEGDAVAEGMGVSVFYTGWLFDPGLDVEGPCEARGRMFDSNRSRRPFSFPIGEGHVIDGWEQGVLGMRPGGQRCLVIPPGLAYGDRAVGGGLIPAGSTLIFEVEVHSVADY